VVAHTDVLDELFSFVDSVNEEPIGFQVTLSVVSPSAYEQMIFVFGWKRLSGNQEFMDGFKLLHVFVLALTPTDITPKLR